MSPSRHHRTDSKTTGGELLRPSRIASAPFGTFASTRTFRFGVEPTLSRCLNDVAFTSKARAAARAPRKGSITYELETPSVVLAHTNFRSCVREAFSSFRKNALLGLHLFALFFSVLVSASHSRAIALGVAHCRATPGCMRTNVCHPKPT